MLLPNNQIEKGVFSSPLTGNEYHSMVFHCLARGRVVINKNLITHSSPNALTTTLRPLTPTLITYKKSKTNPDSKNAHCIISKLLNFNFSLPEDTGSIYQHKSFTKTKTVYIHFQYFIMLHFKSLNEILQSLMWSSIR